MMWGRWISVWTLGSLAAAGCSSSSSTSAPNVDAGPADAGSGGDGASADDGGDAGAADAAPVANDITGTYGSDAIKPVLAGFWIGAPDNPAESAGGPFIYLFSAPVTCADLSKGSGWLTTIPTGTQVLEMIVGSTQPAIAIPTAAHAAANVAEVNYATGGSTAESRATSGNVTLTSYVKNSAVEGTLDVTLPTGSAKGTFHADWCATGNEL
jgi:hypothetical protein